MGYAVLSKRGGVESVTAISLGPFVFLADVKDVRVELHHHEVELAWTLPRGVSDVRVIRKQGGPPKNPRDGERIPAALDHALDRNVDPNEIYHYGIYAIYAMADGRLFPSPGVVVSARPQPPVSALEAPRLTAGTGRASSHRLDRAGSRLGQDHSHGPSPAPRRRLSTHHGRSSTPWRPLDRTDWPPIGPTIPSRLPRGIVITPR